ncbi:MAG: MlaE family ABC transporter permease [Kiritimatiellia bacterium]|jgi:phospholipid/cholesterol/gamma-HCH transport system permease protein
MITRETPILPPPATRLQALGRDVLHLLEEVGHATVIAAGSFAAMRHAFTRRSRREIVAQMYVAGIKSLPVVTVVAFFIGMILALQIGIELRKFSQEAYVGPAVMATMLREMGPFMSGLVLAACVGSAMAAQLGTMTINEEIAALEIMSIDPIRFLVMPRMVAMVVMVPVLSFYTCMMGLLGGAVVCRTQLLVPWASYFQNAMDFADTRALYVGLLKALVFGVLITTVACYEGFSTKHGAVGVGLATRRCVVTSFLLILVVGYFVTRLFY